MKRETEDRGAPQRCERAYVAVRERISLVSFHTPSRRPVLRYAGTRTAFARTVFRIPATWIYSFHQPDSPHACPNPSVQARPKMLWGLFVVMVVMVIGGIWIWSIYYWFNQMRRVQQLQVRVIH